MTKKAMYFIPGLFLLLRSVSIVTSFQTQNQRLQAYYQNIINNSKNNENDNKQKQKYITKPPFPNGLCGGRLTTLSSKDTYDKFGTQSMFLQAQNIQVWLPPSYEKEHIKDYPVLYCHDGQNAMDDSYSWTGTSWRLMGALTRLHYIGDIHEIPIVILLPSASEDLLPGIVRRRHLEYGDLGQPFAEAHCDFIAQVVKPYVDKVFRTRKGPNDTYAIGSSMGGQASLHLLLRHPNIFGGAACLSPYFAPRTLVTALTEAGKTLKNKKLYMDIGGDSEKAKVPWLDINDHLTLEHWWNPGYFWLDTQLQPFVEMMRMALNFSGVEHAFYMVPGARHNERAWAQRIHLPLIHLYGKKERRHK